MEKLQRDWAKYVEKGFFEHVANIGDIDVYANETTVYITVDADTVLTMSRKLGGLDRFVEVLQSLVK